MTERSKKSQNDCGTNDRERRVIDRQDLSKPIRVKFMLEHRGELVNISREGAAVRFDPREALSSLKDGKLRIDMDMNGRLVSLEGVIKHIADEDGQLVLGLEYDRDQVTLYKFK
ncbi:PilZ domain-containing protein [bacterium]|nr:PilZ domain-containing protein [candidate division CSSED10-310 bacterium]